MGRAVDPSYPLLPVATFISAFILLLVMLSNVVRQRWNLGVTFLCFWLFVEHVTDGANFIIWADNADVKLWVYCDIGKLYLLHTRDRTLNRYEKSLGFSTSPSW